MLAPSKAESLYITTDIDPETERDKMIWIKDLDMFVVSGHLYRPLLSSQPWELEGKI